MILIESKHINDNIFSIMIPTAKSNNLLRLHFLILIPIHSDFITCRLMISSALQVYSL